MKFRVLHRHPKSSKSIGLCFVVDEQDTVVASGHEDEHVDQYSCGLVRPPKRDKKKER